MKLGLRITLRFVLVVIGMVIVLLVIVLRPIDNEDYKDSEAFRKTMAQLSTFELSSSQGTYDTLEVGWGKEDIMPMDTGAMAGYRLRKAYRKVDDSLYCRVFVFRKGAVKAAMIELDLLIFPPEVASKLKEKISEIGMWRYDELYLSASHTHSGTGNWLKGWWADFVVGRYNEAYTEKIALAVLQALNKADDTRRKCRMGTAKVPAPEYVKNRLYDGGDTNPDLNIIKFVRDDSSRAALMSYTAHPTTAERKDRAISNDYPFYLMQGVEADESIDFSAFFSGPMGSHAPRASTVDSFGGKNVSKNIGGGLSRVVMANWEQIEVVYPDYLGVGKAPLYIDDLHFRAAKHIRTRSGLFEAVTGRQYLTIDVLRIGNLMMMSTPFDLSGEIAKDLEQTLPPGRKLMVHNFNGAYIGYITPDRYYYSIKKPETYDMNWVGPYNGSMIKEIMKEILQRGLD